MATETNQVITELTVVDKGREGAESHLAWLKKVVDKSKEAADAARKQAEEAKKSSDSQTDSWSRVAGSFERLKRSMDGSFGSVNRYVKDFDTLNKAAVQMIGSTEQINAVLMRMKYNGDLTAQTMNLLANAVRTTGDMAKPMREAMVQAAGLAQAFDVLKRSVNDQYDYVRKLEKAQADLAVKKEILRQAVEKEVATSEDANRVMKSLTDQYNKMAMEMNPVILKSRERAKALLEELESTRRLRQEEARRTAEQMNQATSTRSKYGNMDFEAVGKYTTALYELSQAYKNSTMSAEEYARAGAKINATLSPAAAAARQQAEELKRAAEEQARADKLAQQAAEARSRALLELYNRSRQSRIDTAKQTSDQYQNAGQFRTMGNDEKYWQDLQKYTKALYDLSEAQKNGAIRGAEYEAALKRINETLSPLAVNSARVAEEEKKAAEARQRASAQAAEAASRQAKAYEDFRRSIDPLYDRTQRLVEGQRMVNDAHAKGSISAAESVRQHALLAKQYMDAEKAGGGFLTRLLSIQAVLATFGVGYVVKEIIQLADTWTVLEGRLKQVTGTESELHKTQGELFDVAQRTRVEFGAVVELYTKMARATEDLGLSQINLGKAMETATKAAQLGGGNREGINAALYQFSQGIASNRLGGDELRSILEQAPGLARAIADGLGTTYGKLRELGTQGKLTADVILRALVSASDEVERAWSKVPTTVGQAWTQLQNSILKTIGEVNGQSKFTQPIIDAMDELRKRIDEPEFKQALVVWGKAFVDGARMIVEALKWIADHSDLVKAAVAGLIAMNVASWFSQFAMGATLASNAISALFGIGALGGLGIVGGFTAAAVAIGVATGAMVYFSGEAKKAVPIQDEFNKELERMSSIQDELVTATGKREEALENERQQLLRNAKAEVELQMKQMERREFTLRAQETSQDPDMRARAKEEREQLQKELDLLTKHYDDIAQMSQKIGKAKEVANKPAEKEKDILPQGMDPKKFDELIDKLKVTRESYIEADAAALKLKLTQQGATKEQINQALALQEEIDQLTALEKAVRKKDEAQVQSIKESLTQAAIAEAEGARIVAYYAKLNELMVNSTAEGVRGLAELARASNTAMEAGEQAYRATFDNAMKRIDDTIKRATPKPSTKHDGFNPKSDMKDFEAQTLRNIKANDDLAAAYDRGTDAIRKATAAGIVEQNVLRLGEKNRQRITELIDKEEASKTRLAVSKFVESQRRELETTQAMTDAIVKGTGAEHEAELQAQIRVKLRELNIDTMTKEGQAQAALVGKIMEEVDAQARLNEHKRRMRDAEDNLEQTQLELSLMGQEEHVRERILFLEQERKRIRDDYGPGESAQAAEAWEMAKRTAAANEELSITNQRLEKARALADDVGQFLVDSFVNVDKAGRSVFENIFEGAKATAKRFIANLIADFLKTKIILPIAFQMFGGPVGMGGTQTPYGNLPASAATGGFSGFGGMTGGSSSPFQGGLFGSGGPLSGVGSWVQSWWNKPVFGGPTPPTPRMMSGIDDAGQLGYAPGTGGMGSLTYGGAISSGIGGGFIGLGLGSMVKPGNKAAGAALGAVGGAVQGFMSGGGPIGAVIGGIAGLIGGLFGAGNKPSNYGAGSIIDVSTGKFNNWEDKSNDQVRGARDKLNQSIQEVLGVFDKIGAKFDKALKINYGVGSRDDWTYQVGSVKGTVSKEDTNSLITGIFKALGQQAQGLGEDIAFVLKHSLETDLKKLGDDLDFAAGWKDQLDEFKSAVDGLAQAFKSGKDEGKAFTKSITDFIDGTVRVFASNSDSGLPKYAKGTMSASGGWALVGEEGPELVKLAGGEKIYTASQTEGMMRQAYIRGQKHKLAYINDNEAKLLRRLGGGKNGDGTQLVGPDGIPAFENDREFNFGTVNAGVNYRGMDGFFDAIGNATHSLGTFATGLTDAQTSVRGFTQEENTRVANLVGLGGLDMVAKSNPLFNRPELNGYANGVPFDKVQESVADVIKSSKAAGGSQWEQMDKSLRERWGVTNNLSGIDPYQISNMVQELDTLAKAFHKAGVDIPDYIKEAGQKLKAAAQQAGVGLLGGLDDSVLQGGGGGVGGPPGKSPRDLLNDALVARGMNMTAYNNFVDMANTAGRGEKINPTRGDGNPHDFEGLLDMLNKVEDAMRSVGTAVPDAFVSLRKQLEALDAARKAVDAKIATGGIDRELSETETSVQKLKGYWSEMRGALEAVGYAGDVLNKKLQEGLANGLKKLTEKYMENYNALLNEASGRGYINTINQSIKTRDQAVRDFNALGVPNGEQLANDLLDKQFKTFVEGSNLTVKELIDLRNTFSTIPTIVNAANESIIKFEKEFSKGITQQLNSAQGKGYRNDVLSIVNQRDTNLKDMKAAGWTDAQASIVSDQIAGGSVRELLKNASLTNDQLKDLAATFGQYPGVVDAVNEALQRNQTAMEKTIMDSMINVHKKLDAEFSPAARSTMLSLGINADGDPAFRDRMTGFVNSARNGTAGIGGFQYAMNGLEDQFRAGKITVEQYSSMVDYLSTEFDNQRKKQLAYAQQLVQTNQSVQGAYLNLKQILTGKNSMTGDNALTMAGANYDVSARDSLGAFFRKASKDEASAGDLIWTYDKLTESLKNNQITGEQYNTILGEVNSAWSESAQRINEARDELKNFQKQIRDFVASMDTDNLSVNGPEAKLSAAQNQFRSVLAAVQGGDRSKIPDLLQKASTYRETGQAFYNNTQGYDYIDKEIRNALKGVDDNTTTQINKLDQQVVLLQDGNSLLQNLNYKIEQSRNSTVDSINGLKSLQDQHKHENWIQFQSLEAAVNRVADAVNRQANQQQTGGYDANTVVSNIVGNPGVDARGARDPFGNIQSVRWVQTDPNNLISIGELQTAQRAAGYTGSFADTQAWNGFAAANSAKWNQTYTALYNKAWVGNGGRNWYTFGNPETFSVNREIARGTGYSGNFGPEFDYWMAFQPADRRAWVNAMYSTFGYPELARYAKGGIHDINTVRSLVGGVSTTPTLSVHAEAGMPEAYVPLQDGRTIPVTIKYAMSHVRPKDEISRLESILARIEEAVDRNTTMTAAGEQGTIDNLEELLVETREIRRSALMEKGKR